MMAGLGTGRRSCIRRSKWRVTFPQSVARLTDIHEGSLSPLSRAGVAVKPSRARLISGAGAARDFVGVLSAIWAAPETLFHARFKVYFSRIRGRTYIPGAEQL